MYARMIVLPYVPRVRGPASELTGAYVYRGHSQMPSETRSTVKNGGLGTHISESIHI